ncbi:MAG: hypothetical protein CVV25_09275 [Ignavibacteriae bacterium HGW-Ignavibacteriae-4]|nr:MAG: hypothetical protein CVV25_09275 [Ignavibacteriae bacterium HGW-Ignavibacteriae-4]
MFKKTILFVLLSLFVISCSKDNNSVNPIDTMTAEDMQFVREEEKLARDVYLHSYDKYQLQIFKNISESEQSHMDAILGQLEKYSVTDPVGDNARGVFVNTTLQGLYDELTAKSDESLVEALKVGALIEDLDIFDIENILKRVSESSIINVYNNLTCGSRNHLRSFTSELKANGGDYENIYISDEYYNQIINSDNEKCGNN